MKTNFEISCCVYKCDILLIFTFWLPFWDNYDYRFTVSKTGETMGKFFLFYRSKSFLYYRWKLKPSIVLNQIAPFKPVEIHPYNISLVP
jgi:hypothetical protein